jgi:hypothetical protein
MTCSCGYASARYEPFNILAVPIPEDFMRMFTVHVVFAQTSYALILTVRVDKRSDLASVVEVINRLNLPTSRDDPSSPTAANQKVDRMFVPVEIINSKVHAMFSLERKLEMIREGDNIFLYESKSRHRGMQHGVRSLQLPPPADPSFEYTSSDRVNGLSLSSAGSPYEDQPVTPIKDAAVEMPSSLKSPSYLKEEERKINPADLKEEIPTFGVSN